MPEWIGKTIGKVRIEKFLARGGMAEVYLGTHITLARPVAVKVLHSYIEEPISLERFEREARVVAAMRHPNIVQIHDFDTIDGHPYIVMEYLKGPTLATYLVRQRKKRIPHPQVARLLNGLAAALEYAHERGVIHRDIKPANILLHNKRDKIPLDQPLPEDVEGVLTDFGLVRLVDTDMHTTSGGIMGTPAYMSPEQARGDQIDHRTDNYSLGIVLYELLAGRVPFKADNILKLLSMQIHEMPLPIPELPARIQAVLNRALQKDPQDRHQSSLELALDFSRSIGLLAEPVQIQEPAVSFLFTQISSTFQPKPFDGRCPYKGLDVFEEEDAELFFGREKLVDDLVSRLKESRTLFIIGPSGSGKSSLVRAGLLYALKQGAMESLNSERWLYETMTPGRDPIGELARVISSMAGTTKAGEEVRANALESESIFTQWCEIALKEGRDRRAVLFVDQFEEVFTQVSHEEERLGFLNLLTHAATAEGGRVIVLFAMRSDFVLNCATYPQLNALFNQQSIQIGAMEPNELVSAIAQPALRAGLRIDPDLVAQIVNDMQGEPGALPLMQFALKDLFDAQQALGGAIKLTLANYLNHGGIHKSLERHADGSFARLDNDEQELARSIFSGLIEIGHGTQDTRRTALFDELIPSGSSPADVQVVIQKLADARLITTDEQAGRDTVTISHEKLIEAWPWLQKLVNENREVIALQNEIASDAKEWEDHQRDASYLYTGVRLANAREQLEANKILLNGLAQAFLEAGVKAHADELEVTRQRANELRRRSFYLTGALVAALIAVGVAVFFSIQSGRRAQIVLARQLVAQAQSILATRDSKQIVAVLLATQSMKIFPSSEAAQVLLNNNFAARPISRMTHNGPVILSPNGRYVVSGSSDGIVRVWETVTGKEVARMAHDHAVQPVAFSPDGKYLVSAGCNRDALNPCTQGIIQIWEVDTGEGVARMTHDDAVNSVAFSPDGRYVVSGSYDQTARVWETTTGKEVARMTHDDGVDVVAFSPDGKVVYSESFGETARVWEAVTGKEVTRITDLKSVDSIIFSPYGRYVVSIDSNTVHVWDAATVKEVARMTHDDFVIAVAFSPTGKYVVSSSDDQTARVWETTSGKEVARMTHDGGVLAVAFSPDGKYVVSGSNDHTARVWDAVTGKEVARMTHDDFVFAVAFGPDGRYVVSESGDHIGQVWEAAASKEVVRMTHDGAVASIAFSQDGRYVVSGSTDQTARVWDASTGKEVARMTHDDAVNSIAFSPDGNYVVSAECDEWNMFGCIRSSIHVWQADTGKEVARKIHDGGVLAVAFSLDSRYVVSGSDVGTVRVWEAATGKEVARMTHDGAVASIAFSQDGRYVVSSSNDKTARVWEAATGKEVARMTHDDAVNSVAFSPDGRYVVSSSDDKTARVWEAATGKEVARMTHDDAVNSVAFSPDGRYVVSGSFDRTARVWEAVTGNEVARKIHDGDVLAVAFSPDGRYVVSSSDDKTTRVWYWQPSKLIESACAFLPRNLTRLEWEQYIGDGLPYQAVCPNLPVEPEVTPYP